MRYSQADKAAYIRLCQSYNTAKQQLEARATTNFAALSLALHIAKAGVPLRWRTPKFIRECGSKNQVIEAQIRCKPCPGCNDPYYVDGCPNCGYGIDGHFPNRIEA